MDIKVRPLVVDDVFTVASMLSKITKIARVELAIALKDGKKQNPTELGMVLFQSIFTGAEEELKVWLANLIGKTKDEFVAMPAITVIGVVEALAKHEDILDFFAQASRLTLKKEAQA